MPDQTTVRRALERGEFVVVQEAFATTATCDYADLLLPATTWGEKDGTVTNSERRISRVRPAVPAPGRGAPRLVGRARTSRAGSKRVPAGAQHLRRCSPTPDTSRRRSRSGTSTARATRGRDLDITGLSYAMLDAQGPQQWPLPEGEHAPAARLYEDGVFPTPDGRARFARRGLQAGGRAARGALPVLAEHRPPARPVARHEPHRHAGPPVRPRARAGGADESAGHGAPPAATTATWCTSPRKPRLDRAAGAGQRRGGGRARPSSRCTGARRT